MSVAVQCIDFDCPSFWTRPSSEGFGDFSKRIGSIQREIAQMWGSESVTFGRRLADARFALLGMYRDCARADWDGYGGSPITEDAFEEAKRIIELLPSSIEMPEIVAEPTGDIAFEWRRGRGRILVISVSGKHRIAYAGIFGDNKVYGSEYFEETLPLAIIQHLRRLYS